MCTVSHDMQAERPQRSAAPLARLMAKCRRRYIRQSPREGCKSAEEIVPSLLRALRLATREGGSQQFA